MKCAAQSAVHGVQMNAQLEPGELRTVCWLSFWPFLSISHSVVEAVDEGVDFGEHKIMFFAAGAQAV